MPDHRVSEIRSHGRRAFLGILPGTLLDCYTLARERDLAPVLGGELPPDPLGIAGLVARIVLALVATWLVTRRARAALGATVI